MKNSIKIQRTEPFRKAIGSVSLLKTSQFLFVALFSVSRNSSKINYAFELILYFFKIFASTLCRPQAEQEKNFKRAHDLMIKKMIWMNAWYILIQRSFAMLIEESEENS